MADEMPPEIEQKLDRDIARIVTSVFWVFAACLAVFAVTLTVIGVIVVWRWLV